MRLLVAAARRILVTCSCAVNVVFHSLSRLRYRTNTFSLYVSAMMFQPDAGVVLFFGIRVSAETLQVKGSLRGDAQALLLRLVCRVCCCCVHACMCAPACAVQYVPWSPLPKISSLAWKNVEIRWIIWTTASAQIQSICTPVVLFKINITFRQQVFVA